MSHPITEYNVSMFIHLVICSHEHKIQYHNRIQIQTTHKEWIITFINKIWINKDINKIHYGNIYHIIQLNTINATSTLYHLKFIFQSPIILYMNHILNSRCNNTHQFHNKTIHKHYATIILKLRHICNVVSC